MIKSPAGDIPKGFNKPKQKKIIKKERFNIGTSILSNFMIINIVGSDGKILGLFY